MSSKTSARKAPVTRHPLFPATVALWFGALFGIGSLAIRPALIESLVLALHIDAAIPSAAPPLGATTRIMLALVLAGLGGLLGGWLARRISRPKPVVVQRKRGAAKSDLATPGKAPVSRRSGLALDENAPRRDYIDHAPLPGGASILDVSQFDLDGFEARPAPSDPLREEELLATEPVSLDWRPEPIVERIPAGAQVFHAAAAHGDEPACPDADDHIGSPPAFAPPAGEDATDRPAFAQSFVVATDEAITDRVPPEAPATQQPDAPVHQAFLPPAEPATPDAGDIEGDSSAGEDVAPDMTEPAFAARDEDEAFQRFDPLPPRPRPGSVFEQKLAPALFAQPHSAQVSRLAWDEASLAPLPSLPSVEPAKAEETPPAPALDATAMERIASAPLDTLAPVELLERLAQSMRRKREEAEARRIGVPQAAPDMTVEDIAASDAVTAPPQSKVPPPPIPVIPDALRPVGLDEEDDADLLPAYVPPRHIGQPDTAPSGTDAVKPPSAETTARAPAPADDLEEGYSSLLSLSRPGTGVQRFVRIEEPDPVPAEIEPVVVFPSQEARVGEGPFARPAERPADPAAEQPAARRDPEETDRALRTALANIQRMSGAA